MRKSIRNIAPKLIRPFTVYFWLFISLLCAINTEVGHAKTTIATGYHHNVALTCDGVPLVWGYNYDGQLGDGTKIDRYIPVQMSGGDGWLKFSGGWAHTVAIKTDGSLWAWGQNYGQLGNGTNSGSYTTPLQIGGDYNWFAVSAGRTWNVALKSDGTLWTWGTNLNGELGDGTNISKFAPVQIGKENNWVGISAGGFHVVALKSDGTLWGWGNNYYGQLGDGSNTNRWDPVQIGTDNDWAAITAGAKHTVAIKSNGTLWTWGASYYGEYGGGSYAPVRVGSDSDWISVSTNGDHTVALKSDGTLWGWGYNYYGQVGDGSNANRFSPVQIGRDNDWAAVSAGWLHTIALKSNGTLWTWGYNSRGQLGDGSAVNRNSPLKIAETCSDSNPPTGTISINSDSTYTNSVSVTLNISCSDDRGCDEMVFSNDNINWSTPEPYGNSKAWSLSSNDGLKTVYVKFKDMAGNWSVVYNDTIILDTTSPTTSASLSSGTYNSAQNIVLSCNDGTGSGCGNIYYTTDGSTPTKSSLIYSSSISISSHTTLKFFAADNAENNEAIKTEIYDFAVTQSPKMTLFAVSGIAKDSAGNPLPGVTIKLSTGNTSLSTITDSEGRYTIKNVTAGIYKLRAHKKGYIFKLMEVPVISTDAIIDINSIRETGK